MMWGKRTMCKVIAAIIIVLLMGSQELSARQPRIPYMHEVENPEHYVQLVHTYCHDRLLVDWNIVGTEVGRATDSVVPVVVELSVPREYSPLGIKYTSQVVFKFRHDSLLEYASTWIDCGDYRSIFEYAESREAVRLFVDATAVTTGIYALRGKSRTFYYDSNTGDTLQFEYYYSKDSTIHDYIRRFTLLNPKLLEKLEVFFGEWVPAQLSEFRNNVGIGFARLTRNHFFVNSVAGGNESVASFSAAHSMRFVTGFRLPNNMDWSTFSLHAEALGCIQEWLRRESSTVCCIGESVDRGHTLMKYQCNSSPRRLYVKMTCDDGQVLVASAVVGRKPGIDPMIQIHDSLTFDTLGIEWPF